MQQPSNSWQVQLLNPNGSNQGAPATLASLGIESAKFNRKNVASHTLAFTVGGKVIDAATLWPYGQLLALLKPDGTRFFFGRVEPWDRQADSVQNHLGIIVNPWWYLENLMYQQRYNLPIFDSADNITGYNLYKTPRVILYKLFNLQVPGAWIDATTGMQIADALNWAITQGAPIQIGKMDPATTPMSFFQKGIQCSQVIQHAYRLEPDFIVVWDYTTLPFPTIHCLKQASLTPLLVDLTVPGMREKINLKERPDWPKSYVAIHYDLKEQFGAQTYIGLANDVFPNPPVPPPGMTPEEFNFHGVDLFCDLSGPKIGVQSQQANFASQPFDITSLATWQKWKPDLDPANDPTLDSVFIILPNDSTTFIAASPDIKVLNSPFAVVINDYAAPVLQTLDEFDNNGNPIALDATCIYEITDGAWADWIPNSNAQRVRVTAFAVKIHKLPPNAEAGTNPKWEIVPLSHDFTAVNLNTAGISQDFTQQTSGVQSTSENPPPGLAEQIFNSLKALAVEGSFQNTEAVIGSTQPLSEINCLNFKTPNQPQWATVNAVIQEISGDIANGITNVKFGAPLHLAGRELIDATLAARYRTDNQNLAYVFGGSLNLGAGTTRMSRKHHARHSQQGEANKQVEIIGGQGKSGVITLDSTLAVPDPAHPPTVPTITISAQDIYNASLLNNGGA
jgi:hypothetical protein